MDPDSNIAEGFLTSPPEPLRYDSCANTYGSKASRILSLIPKGARVLDVGCATGAMSCLIRDTLNAEVIGVEKNIERAQIAESKGLKVASEFNETLFTQWGKFDVILFADVLEHLANPIVFLKIAKAGLAPGGAVIVSVPNIAFVMVRWRLLIGRFEYKPTGLMDVTHLRWFTFKSLMLLMERAGYLVTNFSVSLNRSEPGEYYGIQGCLHRWKARIRNIILLAGAKFFPRLFGFQLIVKAIPHAE